MCVICIAIFSNNLLNESGATQANEWVRQRWTFREGRVISLNNSNNKNKKPYTPQTDEDQINSTHNNTYNIYSHHIRGNSPSEIDRFVCWFCCWAIWFRLKIECKKCDYIKAQSSERHKRHERHCMCMWMSMHLCAAICNCIKHWRFGRLDFILGCAA